MVKIDRLHRKIVTDAEAARKPTATLPKTLPETAVAQTPRTAIIPPSLVANKDVHLRKEALPVMQSSAAVAGRALIMLACVVAIPAVALWGTSWPEVLKRLQDFHWPAVLDLASASMSTSPDEAPQVKAGGVTGTLATPCGPGRLAPAESPSPYCLTSNPASLQGQATAATQSAVVPAGYQVPAESAAATPPVVNAAGQSGTAATPAAGDQFHAIQDRLRQLGATYYLLESWGNEQQMYRFYCKMAVGGSADYTRYFEATNSDPLQAMLQVLRQVDTWRDGGCTKAERGG